MCAFEEDFLYSLAGGTPVHVSTTGVVLLCSLEFGVIDCASHTVGLLLESDVDVYIPENT